MNKIKTINDMELYELYSLIETDKIDRKYNNDTDIMPLFYPGTEEEIYEKINDYYLKENGNKLNINTDKDKLYAWAKSKSRYLFLSDLLLDLKSKLIDREFIYEEDYRDLFLYNNIMPIIKIVKNEVKNIFNNNIVDVKLSKMNKEEVIKHVKRILLEIDPSGKWLSIYEEAINDNKIFYLEELSDDEIISLKKKLGVPSEENIENSCISTDKESYITLTYIKNIKDVVYTVHEMIHYINHVSNMGSKLLLTLDEFFSIFYQLYAIDYLDKIGYDNDEIEWLKNDVLNNSSLTYGSYLFIVYLNHYMKIFDNDMIVTEEKDIKKSKNNKKLANYLCDVFISELLLNAPSIFIKYRYIIGNYLAKNAMNKIKNGENILPILKEYVENTLEIDPYDVFRIVGISVEELGINKTDLNVKKRKK